MYSVCNSYFRCSCDRFHSIVNNDDQYRWIIFTHNKLCEFFTSCDIMFCTANYSYFRLSVWTGLKPGKESRSQFELQVSHFLQSFSLSVMIIYITYVIIHIYSINAKNELFRHTINPLFQTCKCMGVVKCPWTIELIT